MVKLVFFKNQDIRNTGATKSDAKRSVSKKGTRSMTMLKPKNLDVKKHVKTLTLHTAVNNEPWTNDQVCGHLTELQGCDSTEKKQSSTITYATFGCYTVFYTPQTQTEDASTTTTTDNTNNSGLVELLGFSNLNIDCTKPVFVLRKATNGETEHQSAKMTIRDLRKQLQQRRRAFPTRSRNSYQMFVMQYAKDHKGIKINSEEGRTNIRNEWSSLSNETKTTFQQMAKTDKVRFQQELEQYNNHNWTPSITHATTPMHH